MQEPTNQLPTPRIKEAWQAPYQCYYCNAHGHKATSCRKKLKEKRARQNNNLKQLKKEEVKISSHTQDIVLTLLKEVDHLKILLNKFWSEFTEKEKLKNQEERISHIQKELEKENQELINKRIKFQQEQSQFQMEFQGFEKEKKEFQDQQIKFQDQKKELGEISRERNEKERKEEHPKQDLRKESLKNSSHSQSDFRSGCSSEVPKVSRKAIEKQDAFTESVKNSQQIHLNSTSSSKTKKIHQNEALETRNSPMQVSPKKDQLVGSRQLHKTSQTQKTKQTTADEKPQNQPKMPNSAKNEISRQQPNLTILDQNVGKNEKTKNLAKTPKNPNFEKTGKVSESQSQKNLKNDRIQWLKDPSDAKFLENYEIPTYHDLKKYLNFFETSSGDIYKKYLQEFSNKFGHPGNYRFPGENQK